MHPDELMQQLHPRRARKVPVILQAESSECGLACLAMIAGAFGLQHTIGSIRAQFGAATRGLKLQHLLQQADALGLHARALRTELDGLREITLPALVHWNFNHYVVVVATSATGILVHNPSLGEVHYSWQEASECFTGIAVEFTPGPNFAPAVHGRTPRLRDVMGTLRGVRPALAHIGMLAIALELAALLVPLYARIVFDQAIPSGSTTMLTSLAMAAAGLVVLHALFAALRSWSVAWLGQVAQSQWSQQVITHLLRLPVPYFKSRTLGDLTSRVGSVDAIQGTLSRQFLESIIDAIASAVVLGLLCLYSLAGAAMVVIALIAATLMRAALLARQRRVATQGLIAAADVNSMLTESLRAITTLKLNNQVEPRVRALWQKQVRRNRISLQIRQFDIAQALSTQVVYGLLRVAVIAAAALQVINGHATLGALVAFLAYADLLSQRAAALADRLGEFVLMRNHIERLAEITGQADEHVEGTEAINPTDASVELRGVGFRYSEFDPWILHAHDLHVAEGESVAIVGPSGCGKSTLARLLTGLLDPAHGEIRIGGVSLSRLGKRRARELIACVMQDDELLAGTIAQNIALFDPDADREHVRTAAIAAHIDDEIRAMPMGYDSLIGDMGTTLSGGQKQRVLLARALYRAPRILILDEATSHLDVACERAVNAAISKLRITRVIIAHRPDTVASADRVIELRPDGFLGVTTPFAASPLKRASP